MKRRLLRILLILFILVDLVIAFLQYLYLPLDGDLYAIVLPAPWYAEVLTDPFGFEALTESKEYGGAGRYSAHWVMSTYFKSVPFAFQWLVNPIQSIYYSAAFFKILMHIGLIALTSAYICRHFNILKREFLLTACAVIPFIHTYGLYNRMGMIDRSITYVFFYIFPFLIFLALLYPLYKHAISDRNGKFSLRRWAIPWLLIAFGLAFFGPMIQSMMMLCGGMIILFMIWVQFRKHNSISLVFYKEFSSFWWYSICLIVFGGLAYWEGLYNVENVPSLPISESVPKAIKGIGFHFIESWHFWVLLAFLIIHFYILRKVDDKILERLKWVFYFIGFAIVIYMVSLPFGGYRSYRSMIYRYDLLIPVTWSFVFVLLGSGYWVLKKMKRETRRIYILAIFSVLMLFWAIDLPVKRASSCEIQKLKELSEAHRDTVILDDECTVLSWEIDDNYYFTEKKVKLLKYWGILKTDIAYIQESPDNH